MVGSIGHPRGQAEDPEASEAKGGRVRIGERPSYPVHGGAEKGCHKEPTEMLPSWLFGHQVSDHSRCDEQSHQVVRGGEGEQKDNEEQVVVASIGCRLIAPAHHEP